MTRRFIDKRLFVYGTLKRNRVANHLLTEMDMEFVCEATTPGRLYSLGAYPVLIPDENGVDVWGELFKIPRKAESQILDRLDQYEGKGYQRQTIPVYILNSPMFVVAYVLKGPLPSRAKIIPGGNWRGA